MASHKKVTESTEQHYRRAVYSLAQLGFHVEVSPTGEVARVKHPQADRYTDVTKITYSAYKDQVQVDARRVAKAELLSEAIAQTEKDLAAQAQQRNEQARIEAARSENVEKYVAAGIAKAASIMSMARGRYNSGNALEYTGEALRVTLEPNEAGLTLTVNASEAGYEKLAKLVAAANRAA